MINLEQRFTIYNIFTEIIMIGKV